MRLDAGQQAPGFSVADLEGRTVSFEGLPGRPVLLSFFRYGSCPLCNLRVAFLMAQGSGLYFRIGRGAKWVSVLGVPQRGVSVPAQRIPLQSAALVPASSS